MVSVSGSESAIDLFRVYLAKMEQAYADIPDMRRQAAEMQARNAVLERQARSGGIDAIMAERLLGIIEKLADR